MRKKVGNFWHLRGKGSSYQFNRAPFGFNFLPAQFHRMIVNCLRGIPGVVIYIDDVLIASQNKEEHIRIVEKVIKRLTEAKLNLNLDR